jgi:hypothetical protein
MHATKWLGLTFIRFAAHVDKVTLQGGGDIRTAHTTTASKPESVTSLALHTMCGVAP